MNRPGCDGYQSALRNSEKSLGPRVHHRWLIQRIGGSGGCGDVSGVPSVQIREVQSVSRQHYAAVVGLKPTYGRVSVRGVVPLSWNLDHIGSLTRTVRDAARMLFVMAGFDPHDPASVNIPLNDPFLHLGDGVRNWQIAFAVRGRMLMFRITR